MAQIDLKKKQEQRCLTELLCHSLNQIPMDEETYAELAKLQLQKMDGTTISIGSVEPCTIAGLKFLEMQYSMELYGVTFHQSMLLHKQGDRMVIMTATYFDELGRSLLLSGFSAM